MKFGIDLGTTNSCVAGWNERMQAPRFYLNNVEGGTVTPSVVYFDPDDQNRVLVGSRALAFFNARPDRVVRGIKRRIGDKNSYDPNINGLPNGADPAAISALILKKLAKDVNEGHQQTVKDVVITVPAYFGFEERAKTKLAGDYAGLNVLELLPEPTAAAISYCPEVDSSKNVIIYDLGGGTFDVTYVRIIVGDDGKKTFKGIALDGDAQLGGMDWDRVLAQVFLDEYNRQQRTNYSLRKEEELIDQSVEARLTATLLREAEIYKKRLTPEIDKLDWIINFDGTTIQGEITLDDFNRLTKHLLDRTIEMTRRVIDTATEIGAGYANIDEILLVGGSTRMPQVSVAIQEAFGKRPQLYDPDFAVANGAAIYANIIGGISNDYDDIIIIRREEGATHNILSKTYGIELADGDVANVLFRNEHLPINKIVNRFCTASEGQSALSLYLYESNLLEAKENLTVPAAEVAEKCKRIAECEISLNRGYPRYTPLTMNLKLNNEQLIDVVVDIEGERQSVQIKLDIQESAGQRDMVGGTNVQ